MAVQPMGRTDFVKGGLLSVFRTCVMLFGHGLAHVRRSLQ